MAELDKILNLLLLPAIIGILWIARSVSRLETLMEQSIKDREAVWEQIKLHTEEIGHVRESIARISGKLDK
jgi:hypothetical protein